MKHKEKLRTAAKIKTQKTNVIPIRTPPLNTATKLFNKPDRKRPFGTLIDKKISPRFRAGSNWDQIYRRNDPVKALELSQG